MSLAIGLDIGTTTISALVLDTAAGETLAVRNIPSGAEIPAAHPWEHLQSPAVILEKISTLLTELLTAHPTVSSIGLTGQMHGILYYDTAGEAVSPLYTWQDGHASAEICQEITGKTGYPISPGYGLATHYALTKSGQVPANAVGISTVMDWVGMRLTGGNRAVIHPTNAASLGLFDIPAGRFDWVAVENLPLSPAFLPEVAADHATIGTYKSIPVSVSIGDNQAAFLGSVRAPTETILVNIGTGSQVSLCLPKSAGVLSGAVETRPYLGDQVLVSGSGLCGGRAYALLERFFRSYATAVGLPAEARYDVLNRLAAEGIRTGQVLDVRTTFCGTREDPTLRGQITGIGEDNFTPEALAAGVLTGIVAELHIMVGKIPHGGAATLVASGNGVRKNPVLREILAGMFGLPLVLPAHTEEAAFGAALFAAQKNGGDLSRCIRYTESFHIQKESR